MNQKIIVMIKETQTAKDVKKQNCACAKAQHRSSRSLWLQMMVILERTEKPP